MGGDIVVVNGSKGNYGLVDILGDVGKIFVVFFFNEVY